MTIDKQRKIKTPIAAYMGFLFQTFLKRPFGYIIAALYIVYLATILLIVPSALHFGPLEIWNLGGFNMPMFNLFFIAGSAASIAVAVFRTGRDDGTDLALSAKPLTKGMTVTLKTIVFLIIMVIMCLTSLVIVALIKPIFGEYNYLTNINGIEQSRYIGMILSVFIANLVNMLFFGGVAVFFTMVGGQIITIVGTVAVVILMCIMNIIYPQAIKSASDILTDKYGGQIQSYSCNTLHQYNHPEDGIKPFNYATITCEVDSQFQEEYHLDTYKYWTKSNDESGRLEANYADFGKQLSNLFNSFGMDESRLEEASKLVIGMNNNYKYNVNADSHVTNSTNVENEMFPISYYDISTYQGKYYSEVFFLGSSMNIDRNNWYVRSMLNQYDFNSVVCLSNHEADANSGEKLIRRFKKHTWHRIDTLQLTDDEKAQAITWFNESIDQYKVEEFKPSDIGHNVIKASTSSPFFEGDYNTLDPLTKFDVTAKVLLYWWVYAHEQQLMSINDYCNQEGIDDHFPYKSSTVYNWWSSRISSKDKPGDQYWNYYKQRFMYKLTQTGLLVENEYDPSEKVEETDWARLQLSQVQVAETYNNLYTYDVESFYNATTIVIVWSIISGILFAGAIIVYKKTDFK